MTKKPREKRREGKPEENGGLWITVMGQMLLGGAAAVLAAVLALLVCSLLISAGAVPERFMERAVLAACVLGALIGGLLAVRRIDRSTLLVGAGVGAILFLLLLLAGTLLFEEASISNGGGMMLLSCLCASGGNCYVYKLARDCGGPAVARDALFYLSLFPFSFFSSLMMTEGLFLLASAGACYYARRRRWILYGVFGAAAALTRMTGLLVILPAAVELLAGERPLAPAAGRSKHCWRRVFCRLPLVLLPAAGTVSYLLLNAWVDGDPFAFVKHQEHWYQGFLLVSQVVEYMVDYFAGNALLSVGWAVWFPGLALFLGGILLLYWGVLRGALPPSLLAYGFFFFTATYCLSWLLSAGRYLSCCFPLFLLLGRLTENRPGFRSALLAGEGISLGLYYCAFLTGAQVM